MNESENDEYDSDAIDSGEEVDSSDVILAFINSDEKDASERPIATHSGRAITRTPKLTSLLLICVFFKKQKINKNRSL